MTRGSIIVRDIGKHFRKIERGRPSTLKSLTLTRYKGGSRERIWGLRHVSFGVEPGRAVGVIGRNGAGKSTLLRIISGVTRPNEGSVRIHGRIGALLEISAGLSDDLTGRENIFLMGVIAGMTRAEVTARLDPIVEFSELQDFVGRPVRTYSTGMKMRLAFAVAVHVEPDVLLIDEVLAVGDSAFQAKCFERIRAIRAGGCTIFLVSHDIDQIREICDDVLFLRKGRVVAYGPADETIALYEASLDEAAIFQPIDAAPGPGPELEPNVNRFGSGQAEIAGVELTNNEGNPVSLIESGEGLTVRFTCSSRQPIDEVIALVGIYGADLTPCVEINSLEAGVHLGTGQASREISVNFNRLDLAGGQYFVTVGLFSSDWHNVYDYHAEAYPFTVSGALNTKGYLRPRVQWATDEAGVI